MSDADTISAQADLAYALFWLQHSANSKSPSLARLCAHTLLDHIDALERERDMLREALEEIDETVGRGGSAAGRLTRLVSAREIARAALAAVSPPQEGAA